VKEPNSIKHLSSAYEARLRRFLNEPIRAYRLSVDAEDEAQRNELQIKRALWIKDSQEAREAALFDLYCVPDCLSELERWRWLALALAGEHFKGCRTLLEAPGGPSQEAIQKRDRQKVLLLEKYLTYAEKRKKENPHVTERALAFGFFDGNRADCKNAGLNGRRPFYQAMNEIRKVLPTATDARDWLTMRAVDNS
jgi:hypothetical protein